ncbi:MAG: hypothetical protein ACTSP9_15000 [Promethearchaeota archaeon]
MELRNLHDRPYLYRHKLSLDDLKIELNCSGIEQALVQAMNIFQKIKAFPLF